MGPAGFAEVLEAIAVAAKDDARAERHGWTYYEVGKEGREGGNVHVPMWSPQLQGSCAHPDSEDIHIGGDAVGCEDFMPVENWDECIRRAEVMAEETYVVGFERR